jgi:hypothetical protein
VIRRGDEEQLALDRPDYERYQLDAGGTRGSGSTTVYSAAGMANSAGFANTALRPDRLDYDLNRINAAFVPYRIRLSDRHGEQRTEHVSVLVGLDNLQPGQQILVNYGRAFLGELAPPSTRDARAERRAGERKAKEAGPQIKREPAP